MEVVAAAAVEAVAAALAIVTGFKVYCIKVKVTL
jgi:hypothetical protein